MTENSTKRISAAKYCSISAPKPVPYTLPEACAFIYTQRLSQQSYQQIRNGAKARFADIYPAYNHIREYRYAAQFMRF